MSGRSPSQIDIDVGKKLCLRRKFLGYSQSFLAKKIGVTFQQIQKYERGINRVSASKLQKIAEILAVDVAYFFTKEHDSAYYQIAEEQITELFPCDTEMNLCLINSFKRIKNHYTKIKIIELVNYMAQNS